MTFKSAVRVFAALVLLLGLCLVSSGAMADQIGHWYVSCDGARYNSKAWLSGYDIDADHLTSVTVEPLMWVHEHSYWNQAKGGWDVETVSHYVTSLGARVFCNYDNLISVDIVTGITEIMDANFGTFENCNKLISVTLPSTLSRIGERAFAYCSALASITLPEGLTEIGFRAFSSCILLNNLAFPSTLKTIETTAFEGCVSLTTVTMNNGLQTIGTGAFSNCALEAAILPDSVISVGVNALGGGTTLKHLRWSGSIPVVPKGIFYDSYRRSVLEILELPEGVTEIGDQAFGYCPLTSVSLPSTLTSIGYEAFTECDALETITLPEGLTEIGSRAFFGCEQLNNIVFPSTLKSVGASTFHECKSLSTLTMNDGLESVGDFAFTNTVLTDFILPDSVTYMGKGVFQGTTTIKYLRWSSGVPVLPAEYARNYNNSALECVMLPEGVTEIGDSAFYGCKSLTTVSLPSTLAQIGNYAFYDCCAIESITLPENLTSIGLCAFNRCGQLNNVVLPAALKTIGKEAFQSCTSLTNVTFNNGLETIGESAFSSTALEDITLPDTVTFIGKSAFANLESTLKHLRWTAGIPVVPVGWFNSYKVLESVELPEGVTELQTLASSYSGVFGNCTALTSVSLPSTLTHIGNRAFMSCKALAAVDLPESVIEIGDWAFENCDALITIDLPEGLVTIGRSAFSQCDLLDNIVFPSTLKTIGYQAFDSSRALSCVTFNDGLETIDNLAFNGTALTDVTLPASIMTALGEYTFPWNSRVSCHYAAYDPSKRYNYSIQLLDSIMTLPAELTTIGSEAFANIAADVIIVPASVTTIADDAFAGCTDLLLSVTADTPAAAWAEANGVPYVIR